MFFRPSANVQSSTDPSVSEELASPELSSYDDTFMTSVPLGKHTLHALWNAPAVGGSFPTI